MKIRERDSLSSIPVILKLLSTLARVRGGTEMLQTANSFVSLKVLINMLLDQNPFFDVQDESRLSTTTGEDEKCQNVWGLSLTVVSAMIYSLGDSSSCIDFVDRMLTLLLF
ncbi:hypothetical protein FRX31_015672 [Thalictrum thalictroides]|uniref:Uncharacterized protein n=1 Tax=Thalictrum thalictroides TaxID=46969 RepID=A0A7J6WBC9_THATH|nr:hypothetical protein FRX31_015672 [Thalictrum thalictroides]